MYKRLRHLFPVACLLAATGLHADPMANETIEIKLGNYRYVPADIQLLAGQPVTLHLVNSDSLTPHNFTLKDPGGELDINVDVAAGESVDVQLAPVRPGNYTFYCKNKLLFMDSHRQKGMQGTLTVVTDRPSQ